MENPPRPGDLGRSPLSGTCSLAVTAQSLLQQPQAVLTGLQRERGEVGQTNLGLGGRCEEPLPLTFTVSLGIFLLEASFRGQSSSGGRGRLSTLPSTLWSPQPPQGGILHPHPGNSP